MRCRVCSLEYGSYNKTHSLRRNWKEAGLNSSKVNLMIPQKVPPSLNTKFQRTRHSFFLWNVHFFQLPIALIRPPKMRDWKQPQAFILHMNLSFGEGFMRTASLCSAWSSGQLDGGWGLESRAGLFIHIQRLILAVIWDFGYAYSHNHLHMIYVVSWLLHSIEVSFQMSRTQQKEPGRSCIAFSLSLFFF